MGCEYDSNRLLTSYLVAGVVILAPGYLSSNGMV